MSGSLKAVVVGGGTGAPVSIKSLLGLGCEVSAVVAMADDGGSTGILRERAGAIPPGDIRKCLVAMAENPSDPFAKAFGYRFDYASNHALGNLMLTALNETGCTFPEAIDLCAKLLHCRGKVYPSTLDQVVLSGVTQDGQTIKGQSAISHSNCALSQVFYDANPPAAYEPAVEALLQADLIVLGPGSLFTSIIPNILVPGILDAIFASHATVVFVCSCADMQGETWGLSCAEHVKALLNHGLRGRLDYCFLNDPGTGQYKGGPVTQAFARIDTDVPEITSKIHGKGHLLPVDEDLVAQIKAEGTKVFCADFIEPIRPTWHDPARLAVAFEEVCRACHLPLG